MFVVAVALALWYGKIEEDVAKTGTVNINKIVSGGLVMWGFSNNIKGKNKMKDRLKARKKGIELTTNMLATIVFLIVVAFFLFLILASIGAEAGPNSNSFFYGVFDSIIRSLPWVS